MTRKALTVCFVAIAILAFTARSAESFCPSCEVSADKRAQYDALLTLTASKQKSAESKHIPYGKPIPLGTTGASPVAAGASPGASHEHMLHQTDYVTWYDDDLRVPLWVAYRLAQKNVTTPRDRLDCFRPTRAFRRTPRPLAPITTTTKPITIRATSRPMPTSPAPKP